MRYVKYCRSFFEDIRRRKEEKRNLQCNYCKTKQTLCDCIVKRNRRIKKNFLRKARILGFLDDLNDEHMSNISSEDSDSSDFRNVIDFK